MAQTLLLIAGIATGFATIYNGLLYCTHRRHFRRLHNAMLVQELPKHSEEFPPVVYDRIAL